MRTSVSLLFIVFSCTIAAFGQHIDQQALNKYLDHIETYNQGIGAVSIFREGKEVYQRSFGQQAFPGLTWNRHTQYQVGSISKVFTAVLIWKLIEQGKLSLNDKLATFYPQVPNADKITIKNMLEHTSGIKRDYDQRDSTNWLIMRRVTDQEIVAEITRMGIDFQPGDSVAYSNSAFYLLKNIVEKKYGAPFGKILQKEIIKPNRLQDLASADMNPTNVFGAYAYHYKDTSWQPKKDYVFHNIIGVGDISTTPRQLNKFMVNLFNGKVLKPTSVAQMLPAANEEFGRNLTAIAYGKKILFGHAGDTKGSHAVVMYDTANAISIAITLNGQLYPHNDLYVGIMHTIYAAQPKPLPYFLPTASLQAFTGRYESEEYAVNLRCLVHDEYGLVLEDINNEGMYAITAVGPASFVCKPLGIDLDFNKDHLVFRQQGQQITLQKKE